MPRGRELVAWDGDIIHDDLSHIAEERNRACYMLGAPPATLPKAVLAELREVGRMMG